MSLLLKAYKENYSFIVWSQGSREVQPVLIPALTETLLLLSLNPNGMSLNKN